MNDEPYEFFQTKRGLEIKRLAIEAGFVAWEDEEWHPAGIVFDWAGADDESLVNFCHLVVRECADIAYEVGLHRQTKHEILRRFGLKVTDEDKAMERQREWDGLTKEEVDSWELPDCPTVFEFVQFIEAKLKEKNNG